MHHGSCLCGAVRFSVAGELAPADACHCVACRKFSGHYFVSSDVPKAAVTVHGSEHLTWFHSSEKVRRGFCSRCGASLFWEPVHRDWIGIALGAIDGATDTHMHIHVFVAEKGDYYEISDGLPQAARIPGQP